jgi:hypothetical protein
MRLRGLSFDPRETSFLSYLIHLRWNDLKYDFGIAPGCKLDDRTIGVRIPAKVGKFSLRHRVQTGSGTHQTSYPIGTRGSFPGGTAAGG